MFLYTWFMESFIYFILRLVSLLAVANISIAQDCTAAVCSKSIFAGNYKFLLTEFHISETSRGRGGAILIKDNYLIYGRAQNDFVGIKLDVFSRLHSESLALSMKSQKIDSQRYEINFLPRVRTNGDQLKRSKRYSYQEFLPKIEGLIFHEGYYYCTYEEYDVDMDDIYFILARVKPGQQSWTTVYKSPPLRAPYLAMGTGGKLAVRQGTIYFTVGDFSLDRVNGLPKEGLHKSAPQPPRTLSDYETNKPCHHRI